MCRSLERPLRLPPRLLGGSAVPSAHISDGRIGPSALEKRSRMSKTRLVHLTGLAVHPRPAAGPRSVNKLDPPVDATTEHLTIQGLRVPMPVPFYVLQTDNDRAPSKPVCASPETCGSEHTEGVDHEPGSDTR